MAPLPLAYYRRVAGQRGKVLIVEDAPDSAELVSAVLEEEGFGAVVRASAKEAFEALETQTPVAVFLDWVLPDSPGVDVCRWLRSRDPTIPIIFVSGRDDEATMSRGLDAGADDFIVKPFHHAELVARLEAHLRKARAVLAPPPPQPAEPGEVRLGDVSVDLEARVVQVGDRRVTLGALEYQLLAYLCRHPGVAISREQILSHVYGFSAPISTERVDLLVRRLRSKLGEGPERGGQIVAVAGFGYRLERRHRAGPAPANERRVADRA
ncbi:MAG: response regulator transcription factor [Candidatus Dormibacteraceae bacterium]